MLDLAHVTRGDLNEPAPEVTALFFVLLDVRNLCFAPAQLLWRVSFLCAIAPFFFLTACLLYLLCARVARAMPSSTGPYEASAAAAPNDLHADESDGGDDYDEDDDGVASSVATVPGSASASVAIAVSGSAAAAAQAETAGVPRGEAAEQRESERSYHIVAAFAHMLLALTLFAVSSQRPYKLNTWFMLSDWNPEKAENEPPHAVKQHSFQLHWIPPLVHSIQFLYHLMTTWMWRALKGPRVKPLRSAPFWTSDAIVNSTMTMTLAVLVGLAEVPILVMLFFCKCVASYARYLAERRADRPNDARSRVLFALLALILGWCIVGVAINKNVSPMPRVVPALFAANLVCEVLNLCGVIALIKWYLLRPRPTLHYYELWLKVCLPFVAELAFSSQVYMGTA